MGSSGDTSGVEQRGQRALIERAEAARHRAQQLRTSADAVRRQMAARRVKGSRKLSAREQEVLTLLSAGCTSKAIASQLHVSPNTANYHLANIYRKLGVHSRVAACNAFRRMVLT